MIRIYLGITEYRISITFNGNTVFCRKRNTQEWSFFLKFSWRLGPAPDEVIGLSCLLESQFESVLHKAVKCWINIFYSPDARF